MTVSKKDLVDRIAEREGGRNALIKRVVQSFLDEIVTELAKGNRIEFREFGVFEVRERRQTNRCNPRTKERVTVPECRVVKFKPGRLMKKGVADGMPAV